MLRRRFSSFLLSLSPAFVAALLVLGTIPAGNTAYAWKMLFWLLATILVPVIFMIRHEAGLTEVKFTKANTLIHVIWILYAVLLLANIIYKMNDKPDAILSTLFWLVPLQMMILGFTWSVIRREIRVYTIGDERQKAIEIPGEIYRNEDTFKTYCQEMLQSGDGFQILLAAKKGGDLSFLNDKTNSLLFLEGQWRNNEKDFNRLRITTEVYTTTKTRLMEAIADALEIT